MKNTYKNLILQGKALSPTASGLCPANKKLTHFSEHSHVSLKNKEKNNLLDDSQRHQSTNPPIDQLTNPPIFHFPLSLAITTFLTYF